MGVCAEQHRQTVGKYNCIIFKKHSIKYKYDDISICIMLLLSLVAAGLIFYLYLITLIMAMHVNYINVSQGCKSPQRFLIYTQSFLIENSPDGITAKENIIKETCDLLLQLYYRPD